MIRSEDSKMKLKKYVDEAKKLEKLEKGTSKKLSHLPSLNYIIPC